MKGMNGSEFCLSGRNNLDFLERLEFRSGRLGRNPGDEGWGYSNFISCNSMRISDIGILFRYIRLNPTFRKSSWPVSFQEWWSAPHPPPATPLRSSAYTEYRQSAASTNHAPTDSPLFYGPINADRPTNHDRGVMNDIP